MTPAVYVEALRVEQARLRLETTQAGVEAVARDCGFGTAETMRRAFHRRLRVAPDRLPVPLHRPDRNDRRLRWRSPSRCTRASPRLTAIGPYEVLSRLPEARVRFIAHEPGPVTTDNGMLQLVAEAALQDVPEPDVICVPGGFGTRALLDDEPLLQWLRHAHETSTWTTSVCTGSLLLAAAGILDGARGDDPLGRDGAARRARRDAGERARRRPGQDRHRRGRLRRDRHGAHARRRDRRRRRTRR